MLDVSLFPSSAVARDRFVLDRRPRRPAHDPWRHQGLLIEEERGPDGRLLRSATVFLTGRECPWRCVMCDLWQYTTVTDTPRGAIAAQLADAIGEMRAAGTLPDQIKLYNAGSFFDPRAVPEADYPEIARQLVACRRVVVECHPRLIGKRLETFLATCRRAAGAHSPPALEVAMGLETAHPIALERLNKRFSLGDFARAAERLVSAGVSLRVFLLVGTPFIPATEQAEWVSRSVAFARQCGASAIALIPMRRGNGAVETLEAAGLFVAPTLRAVEDAVSQAFDSVPTPLSEDGQPVGSTSRIFADTWDLERLASCGTCGRARRERLERINRTQRVEPPVACADGHRCQESS